MIRLLTKRASLIRDLRQRPKPIILTSSAPPVGSSQRLLYRGHEQQFGQVAFGGGKHRPPGQTQGKFATTLILDRASEQKSGHEQTPRPRLHPDVDTRPAPCFDTQVSRPWVGDTARGGFEKGTF